uniref:Uncharacterized protein n=1 Tax=Octopus bimaculoides TaxID=37653 RepID=A0A0L8IEG0_OCTBM
MVLCYTFTVCSESITNTFAIKSQIDAIFALNHLLNVFARLLKIKYSSLGINQ